MRLLLAAIVCLAAAQVEAAPRLEVGKVYEIIWSCSSTVVPTEDIPIRVQTCFSEFLMVKGSGKADWYEVEDRSGARWFINLNQALAVRPAAMMPPQPPPPPQSPGQVGDI